MARMVSNGAIVDDSEQWYWNSRSWSPLVPNPISKQPGALLGKDRKDVARLLRGRGLMDMGKVEDAGKDLARLVSIHGDLTSAEQASRSGTSGGLTPAALLPTSNAGSAAASQWTVVETEAGSVTLVSIQDLQSRAYQWRDWASKTKAWVLGLRGQAEDQIASAAAILVARRTDWAVPTNIQPTIDRAEGLTKRMAADDQINASLKQEESSAGLFARIGVRHQEHALDRDRKQAQMELRSLLVSIGRSAPQATIDEADSIRRVGADLETQASGLDAQVQSAEGWAATCEDEVRRRQEAIKAMGFDALYEAAILKTSGPAPVDSPLVLKNGEQAYLSAAATLARMITRTHYVGGSRGFSFPIGHTGIRYRVGSYSGHPVQQQSLTKLDSGSFVVTNQRVAYVGATKSTSTTLGKIIHVEIFDDGLSIVREGKENPDFYLMPKPKQAVFLLNWLLDRQSQPS
jgi:hypothetical protein